jgi:RES domain-containing protein
LRFQGRCYRAHDPMWSFSPISGDGAAKTGGRFNPKGQATLYLSSNITTAVNECTQGFNQRLQPLTICEYDVDCEPIADLTSSQGRDDWGVKLDDLDCAWLRYLRAGKQAPSWRVAAHLKAAGFAGILVPSFAPSALATSHNLILWRWSEDLPTRVAVFDPNRRLPRDQLSWQ